MKTCVVPKRQCSLLYSHYPPIWLAPALARAASSANRSGARLPLMCAEKIEKRTHRLPRPALARACQGFHTSARLSRRVVSRVKGALNGSQRRIELPTPNITDEKLMRLVLDSLEYMAKQHRNPVFLNLVGLGETETTTVQKRFDEFWPWVVAGLEGSQDGTAVLKGAPSLGVFRATYEKEGTAGVKDQLRQSFQAFNANYGFSEQDMLNQAVLADLRYPTEWYPEARKVQRTIHLHIGPTNSGKTYHALKRLEQAETGIYAGPLRLLAHEVFSRLNAKGKACNLLTGDEQIMVQEGNKDAKMYSCTVEMVSLGSMVDVAVIDEIQMMANPERGWAWTQALLGLRAKELHVCGEARSLPIIKELAAAIGDRLLIHKYERLNPLKVMSASLNGQLSLLRKGDAVIVFSKVGIHAMKKAIEKATGKRVAIVYGALPPEIRAQQAKLFNEEDNDYDYLVASDAIGMGLNLNIKRIVFESIQKFNGVEKAMLPMTEIKQIAGRAGRYKTVKDDENSEQNISTENLSRLWSNQQPGYVTCFDGRHLPHVKKAMEADAPPINAVGIAPPEGILQRFANHFPPQTPYSYVMLRMYEFARLNPRFFLCDVRDQIKIADALRPVKKLTISDLMVFCASPANLSSNSDKKFVQAMAACVAEQKENDILDLLGHELGVLDAEISPHPEYMTALESLHRNLVLYIWLTYRFGTFFRQRPLAMHVKRLVENNINKVLSHFTSVRVLDSKFKRMQKRSLEETNLHLDSKDQSETTLGTSSVSQQAELHEASQAHRLNPVTNGEDLVTEVQDFAGEAVQEESQTLPLVDLKANDTNEQQVIQRTIGSTTTPAFRSHYQSNSSSELKMVVECPELTLNSQETAQVSPHEIDSKGPGEEADERGTEHAHESPSSMDVNVDSWHDDATNEQAMDVAGLATSAAQPLEASSGINPLENSNAVELNPQKENVRKPMHRAKDQLDSSFFTASESGIEDNAATEAIVKCDEERPMVKKSRHQTTIDILDSLISRAPSLKHRSEELRR